MLKNSLKIAGIAMIMISLASCVSMQKYKDLEAKYNASMDAEKKATKKNRDQEVQINELKAELDREKANFAKLQKEYDDMQADYLRSSDDYKKLLADYNEMEAKYAKQTAGNRSEIQKLLADLQTREADLKLLEEENTRKKAELDRLMADVVAKEKKVQELQAILDSKDKELKDIFNKMNEALFGFKDKGLQVYTKNGKVYVSMDEKLLFASGSWQVGNEGKEAIKKVGEVLQKNTDINVLIEGHTDNVPYQGRGEVKDNWDLSVLRANSIVKILLENKGIAPSRVTAAGRGEYAPIVANDTKENKAKNRRTEIILTPKLDELLNILGN